MTGARPLTIASYAHGHISFHPQLVNYKVLEKFSAKLSDVAEKDSEARLIGKNLILSLKPAKGLRKENETKNEKSNSKEI